MAKEYTKEELKQRITFAAIKLHLNCAETMIAKMRDEFVGVEPSIKAEALAFAKSKVITLNTKFKDLVVPSGT